MVESVRCSCRPPPASRYGPSTTTLENVNEGLPPTGTSVHAPQHHRALHYALPSSAWPFRLSPSCSLPPRRRPPPSLTTLFFLYRHPITCSPSPVISVDAAIHLYDSHGIRTRTFYPSRRISKSVQSARQSAYLLQDQSPLPRSRPRTALRPTPERLRLSRPQPYTQASSTVSFFAFLSIENP